MQVSQLDVKGLAIGWLKDEAKFAIKRGIFLGDGCCELFQPLGSCVSVKIEDIATITVDQVLNCLGHWMARGETPANDEAGDDSEESEEQKIFFQGRHR